MGINYESIAIGQAVTEHDEVARSKKVSLAPMQVKVTVSGLVTYVAEAFPGSAQSAAVWRAKKIDESSGTVITWADGNANFDNQADDLASLSYS